MSTAVYNRTPFIQSRLPHSTSSVPRKSYRTDVLSSCSTCPQNCSALDETFTFLFSEHQIIKTNVLCYSLTLITQERMTAALSIIGRECPAHGLADETRDSKGTGLSRSSMVHPGGKITKIEERGTLVQCHHCIWKRILSATVYLAFSSHNCNR